ncbi:MAG: hypothetical protein KME16_07610 [Scytolyngbya sp. HA4215-MV1]|jgi:hypothetical protein|nr:hypothetical protein [Scytolyngbya sp. HA4215-MV1]
MKIKEAIGETNPNDLGWQLEKSQKSSFFPSSADSSASITFFKLLQRSAETGETTAVNYFQSAKTTAGSL